MTTLSPEEKERQLLAAGWTKIRTGIYQSPLGGWVRGPALAWEIARKWGWV
jgi:hypothetical protein